MVVFDGEYLEHYGILRRSGRYPWGSSGNESEFNAGFLGYVKDMKKQGLTETQIAQGLGISTTQLRAEKSRAKAEQQQANFLQARALKDKGYSNVAIGERMGMPESSVRSLLAKGDSEKADILQTTSSFLKDQVDSKGFIDIGTGVETHLALSKERLNTAVEYLRGEGYEVHTVKVRQLGTGHETVVKVLGTPGSTQREVWADPTKIKPIDGFFEDNGREIGKIHEPIPVNPKRLQVKYKEDGGDQADGVIYVRPGAKDLSLGGTNYAQVRIKVGEDHYLKGMAMYKDDLPDGVDLVFNTNKSDTGNKLDALKPIKADADLPFGAITRNVVKDAGTPKEKNVSAMNLVNEEGDWANWSKTLSSQMLSKQEPSLARDQLAMTFERRAKEYDEIMSLTNPTVKKKLLEEFADGTDAAAVHLKAAALPRQASHVILPVASIKPGEVYAPGYRQGETVALIRYPHGGRFEIPQLTVNNRHKESRKLLGDAVDAIGIHYSVAERLSGADFDGDTVLVIPNNSGKIKSDPALEGLKNFDPKTAYPGYPGMKVMSNTQTEMGKISNLITDMTIAGAPTSEIARAVRHSMVVIDAEKHELDYKSSSQRNGIPALKKKYQTKPDGSGGAATLISRKKSRVDVPERIPRPQREGGPVDKKTGKKVYKETGRVHYRTGKPATTKLEALAATDDAHTLSSGTYIEKLYADHSNKLKGLANQARLSAINTPPIKWSPSAKKTYSSEVARLDSALALAKRNAPRERQAQIIANSIVKAKRHADPTMEPATRKKVEAQALEQARIRTGAGKSRIVISPKEWEAIQAGAISNSKLSQILANADMDVVRDLATPKTKLLMTSAKTKRAERMARQGYTRAEIAQALGVSKSTLDRSLDE